MDIELSVIIVNYNGLKYLDGCFKSMQVALDGIAYEIVVVDNKSGDESCNYIKQHYPDVILIESRENLGFGRGNNAAVARAKGKYILLLNNDTVLKDPLLPLLETLKEDPAIGAAGIKMLDGNNQYLKAAGNFPGPGNLFRLKNMFLLGKEFATGNFSKRTYEVDWLTGSFIMMPKKLYEEIGGFDEDYFMYVEDVDLCKKIADRNYKRVFFPQYSYIHFVGYNTSKDHLIIKGMETYIAKHTTNATKTLSTISLSINKAVKRIKKAL